MACKPTHESTVTHERTKPYLTTAMATVMSAAGLFLGAYPDCRNMGIPEIAAE